MTRLSSIWTDRYTRVTFLPADGPSGFISEDEWHVDFCENLPTPGFVRVDDRVIYASVRVREAGDGWVAVDATSPEQARRATDAVGTAEMVADGEELAARDVVRKAVAGVLIAGGAAANANACLADLARVAA